MVALSLIILGVVMRLLPHVANFTPIGAVALFGGVYMPRRYALMVPLTALIVSDAVIGFDSWHSRLTVYGSFVLIALIGMLIQRRKNVVTVIGGSLSGSIIFYLITNFAYFYPPKMYSHSLAGVGSSYYRALPFFRNTLLGDLVYTGLLFGMYEVAIFMVRHKAHQSFAMIKQ